MKKKSNGNCTHARENDTEEEGEARGAEVKATLCWLSGRWSKQREIGNSNELC